MDNNNSETSGGILDIAKVAVSEITDRVIEIKEDLIGDEQSEILSEFKESGLNKIKTSMKEISDSVQLISKSGYDFIKMEVSMGLPPSVSAVFHYNKEITETEKSDLQAEAKDRRIVELILKCLFKANEFYDSANIGNYKLEEVKITLGLSPGVDISFVKKT
ncbi:MAG TPA: hypothetical protein PKC91_08690 [Ignavibacteria bacterium]|nr:hypothetical protein [Ignavibacteria bacterium]